MASPVYNYYMRDTTKETFSHDILELKSKITAQTKFMEVINKSQFTHNGIQTTLFVTSFDHYKHMNNFLYNITNKLTHENLSNVCNTIIDAAETLIKHKTLTVKFAIYTLVNVDDSLIDNINVLEMCANKKKIILQPGVEVDIQTLKEYNMPSNIIHLLNGLSVLNKLRSKKNSKYVCEYYKTNCDKTKPNSWFSFTTLNKKHQICEKHCIGNIKEIIANKQQKICKPTQHVTLV